MLNIQDTSYAGHASAYLITRPVAKTATFTKGVCSMQETDKQFVLRRLEIDNFIQPYAPTPIDGSTITFDANIIPIYQYNLYTELNPVELKQTWSAETMQREMLDLPLSQNDSTYLLAHMFDISNLFIGQQSWRGDTNFDVRNSSPTDPTSVGLPATDGRIAQSSLSVFDGWIKQIQTDSSAINLTGYALSATNSVGALQYVYDNIVTAGIGERGADGIRFLFNGNTQRLIEQNYNIVTDFKNWSYSEDLVSNAFLGYEMVVLNEMPDDTIIATWANTDPLKSQFFFCYNSLRDETNIKMAQKAANSDIWFIKGTIKIGAGIGWADQIVLFTTLDYTP